MFRRAVVLCLLSLSLMGATSFKLYLEDGDYQMVTEYEVLEDRVRFYSTERSQWEEIPLELIDLKRTEAERAERAEALAKDAEFLRAEEEAVRALEREISRIPVNPGVYFVRGDEVLALEQAEVETSSSKSRKLLQIFTPVPVVTGKTTLELEGPTAELAVDDPRQEFYFRLATPENFVLARLDPKEGRRIAQTWTVIPVSDEIVEEQEEVEIFRHQLDHDLYRVWPKEPMPPGEYAFIEFTQGKGNSQMWDFRIDETRAK